MTPSNESLRERARDLHLYGLLAYWDELGESDEAWIRRLVEWEETERCRRSLERRLGTARIGRFKSMVDFDWSWPASCDREAVEDVLNLSFMNDCGNAVLLGPNGIGKSTIARNAAYNAVLAGHNVRFVTASQMLNQLSTQDGATAMERKLKAYAAPHLLVIDELGYLSYGNRHADLLFEVVSGDCQGSWHGQLDARFESTHAAAACSLAWSVTFLSGFSVTIAGRCHWRSCPVHRLGFLALAFA